MIDYTAAEALSFGDVVDLSTRIGVAGGRHRERRRRPGAGDRRLRDPQGIRRRDGGPGLYWDKSAKNNITTTSGSTPAGWAVAPAASEDPDVLVKIG